MNAAATEKKQFVKVYIRQRPFNKSELDLKSISVIKDLTEHKICIKSGYTEKNYTFDQVFGGEAPQDKIYDAVVSPLIRYIILGYNCTVFAYGQTGTGKTHTIIGEHSPGLDTNVENDPSLGIIPRAACHLFSELSKLDSRIEYTVRVSFIEIYNEEVRDLLNGCAPLRVCDDPDNKGSVCMKGLSEVTVCNLKGVYELLNIGTRERQTASTNLNERSSRSHTVFTVLINTREITPDGEELIKTSKLNLVDLAGSENIGRSGATSLRAREAGTINKSLLTLGKVIKNLAQKISHVPYRDSKLTRILQDSLGGNTKTCMIATFSPGENAWEETVSTLEYASAARSVTNCPRVNVNRKHNNFLKDLQEEITKLRNELMAARSGEGFYISQESYQQMSQVQEQNHERVLELIRQLKDVEERKRTKEQELQELHQSFAETKAYLSSVDEELQKKKLKVRQNEHILNYMSKRDDELTQNASLLLKVCETSTKHEEIYYSKYERQCNATLTNAKIAEDVSAAAIYSLKEMQNTTDTHVCRQKNHVNEVTKDIEALRKNYLEDVPWESANCGLTLDDIFKNGNATYTESSIQDYIDGRYSNLSHLADPCKLNHHLEAYRDHIVAKNDEIKSKCKSSITCVNELYKNTEFYGKTKTEVEKMYNEVSENCVFIENQISRDNKLILHIEDNIREGKRMLDKSLLQKQRITEYLESLDKYESENLSLHSKIREHMSDLIDCHSQDLDTRISMVDSITTSVNEHASNLQNQIVTDRIEVKEYLAGLTKTLKNNVDQYNSGVRSVFRNCVKKAQELRENFFKTVSHTSETVKVMSKTLDDYNSDMKKFSQESTNNILDMERDIVSSTHVGDTPVRNSYQYPKYIHPRIPNTRLLEEFNGISEEVDEPHGENSLS